MATTLRGGRGRTLVSAGVVHARSVFEQLFRPVPKGLQTGLRAVAQLFAAACTSVLGEPAKRCRQPDPNCTSIPLCSQRRVVLSPSPESLLHPDVHHLSYPTYFKFALVCFLLSPPLPPPYFFWMLLSHPLTGATPPIGRLSQCVHPLSLTTTSRARRASWRSPSRALHALHPLIRGPARTGTRCPLPSMPPHCSPLSAALPHAGLQGELFSRGFFLATFSV